MKTETAWLNRVRLALPFLAVWALGLGNAFGQADDPDVTFMNLITLTGDCDDAKQFVPDSLGMNSFDCDDAVDCADTIKFCFLIDVQSVGITNVLLDAVEDLNYSNTIPFIAPGQVVTVEHDVAITDLTNSVFGRLQPGDNDFLAELSFNSVMEPGGEVNETDQSSRLSLPDCSVTISNCPANITLDCPTNAVNLPNPTGTLSCTLAGLPFDPTGCYVLQITNNVSGTLDECGLGDLLYSFTFSYGPTNCEFLTYRIDACETVVTIQDTDAPTFTVPPSMTNDCPASTNTNTTGFVTDLEDTCTTATQEPTIVFSDVVTPGVCPVVEVITRTWTAEDCAGNTSQAVQTITIVDTNPPVVVACAPNATVDCAVGYDENTSYGEPVIMDACTTSGLTLVTNDSVVTAVDCAASGYVMRVTREFVATDACGLSAACTQIIDVVDTNAPAIPVPAATNFECAAEVAPFIAAAVAGITDDCSSDISNSVDIVTNAEVCVNQQDLTVTITARDDCGNIAVSNIAVIVNDIFAPAISNAAAIPEMFEDDCQEPDPVFNSNDILFVDTCSGTITGVLVVTTNGVGLSCPTDRVVTAVWTGMDECGNTAAFTSIYVFVDDTPPQVSTCPGPFSEQCPEDVLDVSTLADSAAVMMYFSNLNGTVDDICSGVVSGSVVESRTDACDQTITQTFTFVDNCGNATNCAVEFVVLDTIAPVITFCPSGGVFECDDIASVPPPDTGAVMAVDNCDGGVGGVNTISLQFDSLPSDQGWVYLQDTVNTPAAEGAVFSVDGTQLTQRTVGVVPVTGQGSNFEVMPNVVNAVAPFTLEVTAQLLDSEGGTGAGPYGFAFGVEVAGQGFTLGLGTIGGAPPIIVGPGNVQIAPTVDPAQVHTYRIEGQAGGTMDVYIDGILEAAGVAPGGTPRNGLAFGDGTGNANADVILSQYVFTQAIPAGDVTVSVVTQAGPVGCTGIPATQYVYTATDQCGNQDVCTQTFDFVDTVPPAPQMSGFGPATPITVPNPSFEDREADESFPESLDRYTQARIDTWRHFEVDNNGGPLRIWNPGVPGADETPQGIADVGFGGNAPDGKYVVVVRTRYNDDEFHSPPQVRDFEAVAQILNEPFDPTKSYTLTAQVGRVPNSEAAGGSTNYPGQPDAWLGGYALQIAVGGVNEDGARYADRVVGGTVIAQDANGVTPAENGFATASVTYIPNPADAALAGMPIQIRLCALEDPADHSTTSWAVFDDVSLVSADPIMGVSTGSVVECGDPVPPSMDPALVFTDNCDTALSVGVVTQAGPVNCTGRPATQYVYMAVDSCDNSTIFTQTHTIVDTTAPIFTFCPADTNVDCAADIPVAADGDATAADRCDDTVDVALISDGSTNMSENCIADGFIAQIVNVWAAWDDCGNTNYCTQLVTLVDTTAPEVVANAHTVDCTVAVTTQCVPGFVDRMIVLSTAPDPANPMSLPAWPDGQPNVLDHFGAVDQFPLPGDDRRFRDVGTFNHPVLIVPMKMPCAFYEVHWEADVPFACYHYIDGDVPFDINTLSTITDAEYDSISIGGIGPGLGNIAAPGTTPFAATNFIDLTRDSFGGAAPCNMGESTTTVYFVFSAYDDSQAADLAAAIKGTLVSVRTADIGTELYPDVQPLITVLQVDPSAPQPVVDVTDDCSGFTVVTNALGTDASDPCREVYSNLITVCDDCGNCASDVQVIYRVDTNPPTAQLAQDFIDLGCVTEPPNVSDLCICAGPTTAAPTVVNVIDPAGGRTLDRDATLVAGTGQSVPLVQFRSDVVSAMAQGIGGVIDFESAPNNADTATLVGEVGCTRLEITSPHGVIDVGGSSWATSPGNALIFPRGVTANPIDSEVILDFAVSGTTGSPGLTQLGFAWPDAGNDPDNLEYNAQFQLSDGNTATLRGTTGVNGPENEDHWFGYKAPAGVFIQRVILVGPTTTDGNFVRIDDLAYVIGCDETDVHSFFESIVDNCDHGTNVVPSIPFEISTNIGCHTIVYRRFDVTDDCGNATVVTQTVRWISEEDHIPPTFTGTIEPENVGCNNLEDIPDPRSANIIAEIMSMAEDDCQIATAEFVKATTSAVNELCEQYITHHYRIYDACWNYVECEHSYINIVDTDRPELFADPLNFGCNPVYIPPPLEFEGLNATDDCGIRDIIFVGAVTNVDGCTYTETRRYVAEDKCGRFSLGFVDQLVTWTEDPLPPQVVWPEDVFLCVESVDDAVAIATSSNWNVQAAMASMVSTDNCSVASTNFLGVHTSAVIDCTFTMTRFFRVLDECGHAVDGEQVLTFQLDDGPPQLLIDNLDLGCNPQYRYPTNELEGIRAIDGCGDVTIVAEPILVVTQGQGAAVDCACAATYSVGDRVMAIVDNAGFSPINMGSNIVNSGMMGTVVCGDSDAVGDLDLLVVWDGVTGGHNNTNPCECAFEGMGLGTGGWWVRCDEIVLVPPPPPMPGDLADGCDTTPGHKTVFRQYVATDSCGNTVSGLQVIAWTDDCVPPAFTAFPSGGHVGCGAGNVPVADVSDVVAVDDVVVISTTIVSDVTNAMPDGCTWQVTRIYRAMDGCGNAREKEIVYTYTEDAAAPQFVDLPQTIDLGCNPSGGLPVPNVSRFAVTDNCSDVVVTFVGESAPTVSGCVHTVERTYMAADGCGNTNTEIVTYHWTEDLDSPVVEYSYVGHQGCLDPQSGDSLLGDNVTVRATYQSSTTPAPNGNGGVEQFFGLPGNATVVAGATEFEQYIGLYDINVESKSITLDFNLNTIVLGFNPTGPVPADTFWRFYLDDLSFGPGVMLVGATPDPAQTLQPVVRVTGSDSVVIEIGPGQRLGNGFDAVIDLQTVIAPATVPSTDEELASITNVSSDVCSDPSVEYIEVAVAANDCLTSMIRTYRVADDCGNHTDLEVEYSWYLDTVPLEAELVTNVVDLGCNPTVPPFDPAQVVVTSREPCGDVTIAHRGDSTVLGECSLSVERVYEISDDCESITVTQTFNGIKDSSAGVIDITTPEVDLGCATLADVPHPTNVDFFASDNCADLSIDDATITVVTQLRTACETVIDHFYVFEDACGNQVRARRTVRLQETGQDTEAPIFVDSPLDDPQILDLGCNPSHFPNPDDHSLSVTDNCGVENVWHLQDVDPATGAAPSIDGAGACWRTNMRTYAAVDVCGNVSTGLVVFVWKVDVEQPTIVSARPELFGDLGCNPTARGIDIEPNVSAVVGADNCDGDVAATLAADLRTTNGCEISVVYVYRFSDECGNSVDERVQFRYTVDTAAPVISDGPADDNLGCNPLVVPNPDPGLFDVTDDCDAINADVSRQQSFAGCVVTVSDTYTFEDDCGNSTSHVHTLTYTVDEDAPIFVAFPLDEDLGCNPESLPPLQGQDIAVDLCGAPTVTVSAVRITNGCTVTMIRTYTATDACENETSRDHTLTWTTDTEGPVFEDFENTPVIHLGCNPTPVPPPDVTAFSVVDDCEVTRVDFLRGTTTVDNCTYTMTRWYTAEDGCGNVSTGNQTTIWTEDTKDPVILSVGPEGDLGCNPDTIPPPDISLVVATDNCQLMATSLIINATNQNGCEYEAVRVYRVMDACGNFADRAQILTWTVDTTPPTITCPDDMDLGCNPGAIPTPNFDLVQVEDDCEVAGLRFVTNWTVQTDCTHTRYYVIEASDVCDNTAQCTQIVTWTIDVTPPTILSTEPSRDLGCNPGTPPAADTSLVTAEDDCPTDPVISHVGDVTTQDGCRWTLTRTYRATDGCGNITDSIVVHTWVNDTTGPTIDAPAPGADLGCNPVVPGPRPDLVQASDACGDVTVTLLSQNTQESGCNRTLTYTYRATDDCGNSTDSQQVLTYTVDTVGPTIVSSIAGGELGCNPATLPTPDPSRITATDQCGTPDNPLPAAAPTVTFVNESRESVGCNWTLIHAYRIDDGCGNSLLHDVVYTYRLDDEPPVINCLTNEVFVDRAEDGTMTVPDLLDHTEATDTCDGIDGPVTVTQIPAAGTIISNPTTVVMIAVDECGNQAECSIDVRPSTIAVKGFVFEDTSANGLPDEEALGTLGINGATLTLTRYVQTTSGAFVVDEIFTQVTRTSPDGDMGWYCFEVPPGAYELELDESGIPASLIKNTSLDSFGLGPVRTLQLVQGQGVPPELTMFGYNAAPTAIDVAAIDATGGSLTWSVGSEQDVLGYNVIDAATGEQVNETLILADGNGSVYSLELGPGTYVLEEIGTDLSITLHDPVTHYPEVDASPVGEPIGFVNDLAFTTSEDFATYLVIGTPTNAKVLDVTDPDNPVRLRVEYLESEQGDGVYFSYPAGADIVVE